MTELYHSSHFFSILFLDEVIDFHYGYGKIFQHLEVKMMYDDVKRKVVNIAFCILFGITICLSVGFWIFLGSEANKENIEAFKNYLAKEGIEITWSDKDDKLSIKHNNIELNQIKDFKLMKSLSYVPNEMNTMRFLFEGVDDIQDKLFFGNALKNEFTQIKVMVNNMENEALITHKELTSIYEKFYPYQITVCDMDSYLYLNKKEITCPESNHIDLVIDTVSKSYTMNINYYKDWGGIAARYLTYSMGGMENKLADFKVTANQIKDKFGDDLAKLKIEKIDGKQIFVNGMVKKTIRPLETEFLAIVDDKKDYIERDIGEVYYYVAFTKNNAIDDFYYIITQLVNKDAAKRKQMKDMQLKHNDDIKINDSAVEQAVEPEKKVDKVVKPIEDEKPEVIIEQLEKEIKEAETPKPVPEAPKPIETKPLSDNKKVSVDDKKDAVKDVIKEKVKKIESDSKAIVEIKPTEKTVEKKAITKP
jgi:hypothetical protein